MSFDHCVNCLGSGLKILWGSLQYQQQWEMWKHFPQQAASQNMRQKFQSHGGAKAQEKCAGEKQKTIIMVGEKPLNECFWI